MNKTEIIEIIKDAAFFGGNIQSKHYEECRNFFDNVIEKQLIIPAVSELFAFGKEVEITHCIRGHDFFIGEKVVLIEQKDDMWLAKNKKNQTWYITEDEANVC